MSRLRGKGVQNEDVPRLDESGALLFFAVALISCLSF